MKLTTTKPEATKGKYGDILGTIKAALKEVKKDKPLRVSNLVLTLQTKHKVTKNQGYSRINNIIERAWFKKAFVKKWDQEGHTYLCTK
jgi:propanediol dehydratase small subunit